MVTEVKMMTFEARPFERHDDGSIKLLIDPAAIKSFDAVLDTLLARTSVPTDCTLSLDEYKREKAHEILQIPELGLSISPEEMKTFKTADQLIKRVKTLLFFHHRNWGRWQRRYFEADPNDHHVDQMIWILKAAGEPVPGLDDVTGAPIDIDALKKGYMKWHKQSHLYP